MGVVTRVLIDRFLPKVLHLGAMAQHGKTRGSTGPEFHFASRPLCGNKNKMEIDPAVWSQGFEVQVVSANGTTADFT